MNDHKYWIALDQTKGIGFTDLKTVYHALKPLSLSIMDLFNLTAGEIKGEFSFNDSIISAIERAGKILHRVEEDYCSMLDLNIDTILFFEDAYPKRFYDTLKSVVPPVLYTYGNKSILKEKGAAVLAEGDISERGENITNLAVGELTRHKIATICYMDKGADIVLHSASLSGGRVIAVVPYGMFRLTIPETLKDIFNNNNIVIISPFYPAVENNRLNTILGNRLICALSYSVYVVESLIGSMIFEAAKSAGESGIPLFITAYKEYPSSASANKLLIDEGARPVKGRYINGELRPNLDELIGIVKSGKD